MPQCSRKSRFLVRLLSRKDYIRCTQPLGAAKNEARASVTVRVDCAVSRRAASLGRLVHRLGALGTTVVLLLRDARGFAAAAAQIIELGAADLAAADDLDGIDHGRIERENALHALAVGNLAHGEILVEAGAGAADAHALIALDAGALALDHLDVHEQRVAGLKIGNFLAGGKLCDLLFLELLDQVHGKSPSGSAIRTGARSRHLCGSGELLRHRGGFVTRPARPSRAAVFWVACQSSWARPTGPDAPPRGPDGERG